MKTKQRENRKTFKAVLIVLALVLPMGAAADELQERLAKLDTAKAQLAENPTSMVGRTNVAICNYNVAVYYVDQVMGVDCTVPLQADYQKQVALRQTCLKKAVPYVEGFWQIDTTDTDFRRIHDKVFGALYRQKIAVEMPSDRFEVPYTCPTQTMHIPVTINGIELNMIFDTGCSDISLSSAVYQMMVSNGSITEADGLGTTSSLIADGSRQKQSVFNLRTVQLGGANGIVFHNVECSVDDNPKAPLLLGRAVTEAFSKVEVDNQKQVIVFYK